MISPIGSWLVSIDGSIIGGATNALQGLVPEMAAPIGAGAVLSLAERGHRIVAEDREALAGLGMFILKLAFAVVLATEIGNYTNWVLYFFFNSLPSYLTQGIAQSSLVPAVTASGVTGTAAVFDGMYAKCVELTARILSQAGTLDVGSRLSAYACSFTVGLFLMAMAGVYELSRVLMGIVLVLGPPAIGCTVSPITSGVFDRWLGKLIALVCLQVSGIVLLQMLFVADQQFLAQVVPPTAQAGTGLSSMLPGWLGGATKASTLASDIQALISMVIWFGMGAFALYALPAIAYSIGTGIATNSLPLIGAALFGAAKALSDMPTLSLPAPGGGVPDLDVTLAPRQIEGGGTGNFASAPPPSLADATPLMIEGY